MNASPTATHSHRQRGQAAVEFALVLPLVAVMTIGVLIVAVAVRDELAVELAAREGARAASVSADPRRSGVVAAQRAVAIPVTVDVDVGGDTVTVTVSYVDAVDVVLIGSLIGPIAHRASVTMALDPP